MTIQVVKVAKAFSLAEIRDIPVSVAKAYEVVLWPSCRRYLYDPGAIAPDDGLAYLQPSVAAIGNSCCAKTPGRWVLENLVLAAAGAPGGGGGGGGGGSGFSNTFSNVPYVGGAQTVVSGVFVDVTGSDVHFTIGTGGAIVTIDGTLSAASPYGAGGPASVSGEFGIWVDGIDFPQLGVTMVFNTVFSSYDVQAVTMTQKTFLPAGAYIARLRALSSGGINIASTPGFPTTCQVSW